MIYLASPYSDLNEGVVAARAEATAATMGGLLWQGHHVFSPITMCHHVTAEYGLPTDFDFWREFNFDMIRHAVALWVLTLEGWQGSRGVTAETDFAQRIGVPVRYIEPATLKVTTEPSGAEA